MAKGLPNTDPAMGRLNKSSEEANALNKQIKEEGVETNDSITEQLALIASFTEVMKNYIPKLGFIDAHTQALKLKQDQAFKVLEKIEGHLAKAGEQVDEDDSDESDADSVDPDEETPGAEGDAAAAEESEDAREEDASPFIEQIAEDVAAIRSSLEEGGDDARDPDSGESADVPDESGAKDGKAPKGLSLIHI